MSRYEYNNSHERYAAGWDGHTFFAMATPNGKDEPRAYIGEKKTYPITNIGNLVTIARKENIVLPPNVVVQMILDQGMPGEVDPFEMNLQGWTCVCPEIVDGGVK